LAVVPTPPSALSTISDRHTLSCEIQYSHNLADDSSVAGMLRRVDWSIVTDVRCQALFHVLRKHGYLSVRVQCIVIEKCVILCIVCTEQRTLNLFFFILRLFISCIVLLSAVNLLNKLNAHYYSHMNVTYIVPTCFGVCTLSAGST
jgi:hypothetical protein